MLIDNNNRGRDDTLISWAHHFYTPHLSFTLHQERKSGFRHLRQLQHQRFWVEGSLLLEHGAQPRKAMITPHLMTKRDSSCVRVPHLEPTYKGQRCRFAQRQHHWHQLELFNAHGISPGWSGLWTLTKYPMENLPISTLPPDLQTQLATRYTGARGTWQWWHYFSVMAGLANAAKPIRWCR
jgi:hypothetical protein